MLKRITDGLEHRGPDGAGYWLGDTADGAYQIGLGHRRLSIIDIAGGSQPMQSSDGKITLIFNGEIYNYIELRSLLKASGHQFQTHSDTEVVIEAYREWGAKALRRFRGMFAFALWDDAAQTLLVAKDAFGKKPLFCFKDADRLVFSSEIAPLLSFPKMDRVLNDTAILQYMLNRYVPGPHTFFAGIEKLPPGCYGVWRDGSFAVTRYFDPPLLETEPDVTNLGDATDLFAEALDDAVRLRMRSDAPFGAFLSGGIDSSSIVATMIRHGTDRVRTFSVGFNEAPYSELAFAKAVACALGTDHNELVVTPQDFLDIWPLATLRRGAPVSEPSDIPILMLSNWASRQVKMVLTGEGADELLGGYPKHRAESYVDAYQRLIPEWLHSRVFTPMIRSLPYGMRRAKVLFSSLGLRDHRARMQFWFGGMNVEERSRLLIGSAREGVPDAYPYSLQSGSSLRRTLFFDQTSWLPDNLLERGDRMMMAGSIEGRMPFMDTELAIVAARLPDRFLTGFRMGKLIERLTFKNILPREILQRRKVGFRVPVERWLLGPWKEFAIDLLMSSGSRIGSVCHPQALARMLDDHFAVRQNNERTLWSLMALEMFFRTFKIDPQDA